MLVIHQNTLKECNQLELKDKKSDPQIHPAPCSTSLLPTMATYYHYTDADSLVKIVREKLLLSSEGSGLSAAASESVFFTKKVTFCVLELDKGASSIIPG